jgi:predicted nucleotidyltransferase
MSTIAQRRQDLPLDAISAFCRRWNIREFALFGSALRDDFKDASDIDVLVQFREGMRYTLFDLARMSQDLEEIFQRNVDLLDRRAVESSPNHIRRDNILQSAQVIYAT